MNLDIEHSCSVLNRYKWLNLEWKVSNSDEPELWVFGYKGFNIEQSYCELEASHIARGILIEKTRYL